MRSDREPAVIEALVSLASALAKGDDIVDMLNELTASCARILDVESAGLLLADPQGVLHVMAASSDQTHALEVIQSQRDEGPCRDCFHTGEPVHAADLAADLARWPQFVPAALAAGFASVHAVPMRLRDRTLGALGLFGHVVGELNAGDLALGQALADVASVALVQDRIATDHAAINEQLQTALESRVVLEQAKGLLAQQGNLDMAAAFAALRRFARDRNLRLAEVAQALVARELPTDQVLANSQNVGTRRH